MQLTVSCVLGLSARVRCSFCIVICCPCSAQAAAGDTKLLPLLVLGATLLHCHMPKLLTLFSGLTVAFTMRHSMTQVLLQTVAKHVQSLVVVLNNRSVQPPHVTSSMYSHNSFQSCASGDVSFHSGWTFHQAGGNNTDKPREVFTIIFMVRNVTAIGTMHCDPHHVHHQCRPVAAAKKSRLQGISRTWHHKAVLEHIMCTKHASMQVCIITTFDPGEQGLCITTTFDPGCAAR